MGRKEDESPKLLDTAGGRKDLKTVEYKGRLLYSKYNPTKAIETTIEKQAFLPGTLVVIFSPVLWYGIEKLKNSLPSDCKILALEEDENLFLLSQKILQEEIPLFLLRETSQIDSWVRKSCLNGKIKRVFGLDFSAGVGFAKEKYERVLDGIREIIAVFWKNRVTLVKIGHLFSRNFIRNLPHLDRDSTLEDEEGKVNNPIIVFGAGEGLDFFPFDKIKASSFYILAVDAALPSLLERGIKPDAVVAMESQVAIEKAYIGSKDSRITLFLDLCSRSENSKILGGKRIWFSTKYSDGSFFDRLKDEKIIKNYIEPLGSVGLASVFIALKIRESERIPIFIVGLDFSFSVGRTHAKGTAQTKQRLISTTRIKQIDDIASSFSSATEKTESKKTGEKVITTKVLSQYAFQFNLMFASFPNLFDASIIGLDIGLTQKKIEDVFFPPSRSNDKEKVQDKKNEKYPKEKAIPWCKKEKNELLKLKDLLSNGEKSVFFNKEENLENQIRSLIECREYLFLHFPDGFSARMDTSFLKRVRAEIDFFIKEIDIALKDN